MKSIVSLHKQLEALIRRHYCSCTVPKYDMLRQVSDDSSQHSLVDGGESSCGADGPDKGLVMSDELSVVDLRLKSEIARDTQSQVCHIHIAGYVLLTEKHFASIPTKILLILYYS